MIPDGSVKQNALVADSTGLMRVSVWGDYVGKLRLNACYSITNFMVKEYFRAKYLTMGRSPRSEIEEMVDIGTVSSTGDGEVALKRELKNAKLSELMSWRNTSHALDQKNWRKELKKKNYLSGPISDPHTYNNDSTSYTYVYTNTEMQVGFDVLVLVHFPTQKTLCDRNASRKG